MLPPPFTYRGGVLLGQQLRALCLETEVEKRKKINLRSSVSVPLVKGDKVGPGLGGQGHESRCIGVCRGLLCVMMIAFITIKSSLVPLIEGLCAQIYL